LAAASGGGGHARNFFHRQMKAVITVVTQNPYHLQVPPIPTYCSGRDGKNFTSSRKPYPLRSAKVHLSQLPSITRLPGLKLAKMAIFGDFPIESGHMNMLYNQAYGVKWNFHL
jgi:hypothetical protein